VTKCQADFEIPTRYRQTTNASADDPTFAKTLRKTDTTLVRAEMQTFIFSATLSKDLQGNLKRGNWRRNAANKKKEANTLDDLFGKLDFRDEKPEVIDLSPQGRLVATLRESMVECLTMEKVGSALRTKVEENLRLAVVQDLYLYYFLLRYPGRSLVFVGSIDGIRRLVPLFDMLKVPVYPLHSQLQQKQRLKNLDRYVLTLNTSGLSH
jgi:ATP-dependent RNA helicase DDX24/MAK5